MTFKRKKKAITITNVFQKMLDKPCRKPNKIWVDKGSEFYNRSIKLWLQYTDIAIYSTHNEEKPVVADKSIRILKDKIFKCMTAISHYI